MSYQVQWLGGPRDGKNFGVKDGAAHVTIANPEYRPTADWTVNGTPEFREMDETALKTCVCPIIRIITRDGKLVYMAVWPTINMEAL